MKTIACSLLNSMFIKWDLVCKPLQSFDFEKWVVAMATGWPAKHDPSHWPLHYYWGLCEGQKKQWSLWEFLPVEWGKVFISCIKWLDITISGEERGGGENKGGQAAPPPRKNLRNILFEKFWDWCLIHLLIECLIWQITNSLPINKILA